FGEQVGRRRRACATRGHRPAGRGGARRHQPARQAREQGGQRGADHGGVRWDMVRSYPEAAGGSERRSGDKGDPAPARPGPVGGGGGGGGERLCPPPAGFAGPGFYDSGALPARRFGDALMTPAALLATLRQAELLTPDQLKEAERLAASLPSAAALAALVGR